MGSIAASAGACLAMELEEAWVLQELQRCALKPLSEHNMDLSTCQGALSVPLEALSSPWALHQWLQDQLLHWQVRPVDPFDKPVS